VQALRDENQILAAENQQVGPALCCTRLFIRVTKFLFYPYGSCASPAPLMTLPGLLFHTSNSLLIDWLLGSCQSVRRLDSIPCLLLRLCTPTAEHCVSMEGAGEMAPVPWQDSACPRCKRSFTVKRTTTATRTSRSDCSICDREVENISTLLREPDCLWNSCWCCPPCVTSSKRAHRRRVQELSTHSTASTVPDRSMWKASVGMAWSRRDP
jgi:hypothetical protein